MTKSIIKAYELEGITPTFHVSNGSGDANIFSGKGFHCSGLSTGMNAVHTTEEYLIMEDWAQAFNIVWTLMTSTEL